MAFENLFRIVPVENESGGSDQETNVTEVTQDAPGMVESTQTQASEAQTGETSEDTQSKEFAALVEKMEQLEKRIADLSKHAPTVSESAVIESESTKPVEDFKSLRDLDYLIGKNEMR